MWYVLQVKTGDEQRIRDALLTGGIRAATPMENSLIRKGGTWTSRERILFPSYVFVELEYNAENYYRCKGVTGVIRFLGTGSTPSPLTYQEEEWVKDLSSADAQPLQPTKVRKNEDGSVEILDGVLKTVHGKVVKFNPRNKRAILEVTFCGTVKQVQLSIEIV